MVLVMAALALAIGATATLPQAASGGTIPGGVVAGVSFGTPPADGASGSGVCTWRRANPYDAHLGHGGEVSKVLDGQRYWLYERRCEDSDDLVWIPELTPSELAVQAAAEVRRLVPAPPLLTAPALDRAVVNAPLWFWTAQDVWQSVEATAWVLTDNGVMWATARAVPVSLRFDPGDGPLGDGPVTCVGPGTPWSPRDGDHAWSACSATVRRPTTSGSRPSFAATLSIVWHTSWWSNSGSSGTLEPLVSSTTAPLEVHEIHALVSR